MQSCAAKALYVPAQQSKGIVKQSAVSRRHGMVLRSDVLFSNVGRRRSCVWYCSAVTKYCIVQQRHGKVLRREALKIIKERGD